MQKENNSLQIDDFELITEKLLNRLKKLDSRLRYHNINHTMDVVKQSERIANEEKSFTLREIFLLKLAALYHDSGFLYTYTDHEKISCRIFLEDSRDYNLSKDEINQVKKSIMATKTSRRPKTIAEKILKDADLDYLGRKDFRQIGDLLKEELFQFEFIYNDQEWNNRQLSFIKKHRYYTKSSKLEREPLKRENYYHLLLNESSLNPI